MVASWVSQASFEPLGLTIAVAKDRAIESMMQVGLPQILSKGLQIISEGHLQNVCNRLWLGQQDLTFDNAHAALSQQRRYAYIRFDLLVSADSILHRQ